MILDTKSFQPDLVLHLGGPPTSKNGLEFFKNLKSPLIQVHPFLQRLDPHHNQKIQIRSEYNDFISNVVCHNQAQNLNNWQSLNQKVQTFLNTEFETHTELTEPFVAFTLTKYFKDCNLFVGSSRPIRDIERFGLAQSQGFDLYSNRGASGIDGNLATIAGIAQGSDLPTVALLGDLAALYDLNSLSLIKKAEKNITLFVINNDGGGIFSFLPVADNNPAFEKFWGTPHGLNFSKFAEGFGINYSLVETKEQFLNITQQKTHHNGVSIIEIKTNRNQNIEYHKQFKIRLKEHFQ